MQSYLAWVKRAAMHRSSTQRTYNAPQSPQTNPILPPPQALPCLSHPFSLFNQCLLFVRYIEVMRNDSIQRNVNVLHVHVHMWVHVIGVHEKELREKKPQSQCHCNMCEAMMHTRIRKGIQYEH